MRCILIRALIFVVISRNSFAAGVCLRLFGFQTCRPLVHHGGGSWPSQAVAKESSSAEKARSTGVQFRKKPLNFHPFRDVSLFCDVTGRAPELGGRSSDGAALAAAGRRKAFADVLSTINEKPVEVSETCEQW